MSNSRRLFLPASILLAALTLGTATVPAQALASQPLRAPAISAAVHSSSVSSVRPLNRAAIAKAAAAKAAAARVAHIRSSIVSVALSKVGASYVAGHAGPWSFDCSGLALYVYAKAAGISLPHYSYSQYDMSQHISSSSLRPGDLVFFFRNGAHHVGIYIGGGKMVNAASPSSGVRVDYIFGPWYGSHYSGAGRLL
jgi:cell wall-associated NlpC family hydrolase